MDKRHLKSPRLPGNDTHSGVEYTALVAEGTALTQTSNAKGKAIFCLQFESNDHLVVMTRSVS